MKTLLGLLIGMKPANSDFILSEEPSSINEGTSFKIKTRLGKRPDSSTTITITSSHPALEVNDSSSMALTFTPSNYSSDQSFTIAALIDNNPPGNSGYQPFLN